MAPPLKTLALAMIAGVATLVACSGAPASAAAASRYFGRSAPGGLVALANSIRAHGCDGRAGVGPPLRGQSRLNAAAQALARGASLRDATASAGYRATSSLSLHVSGNLANDALSRMLAAHFCAQLTEPALRDIGFYREGDDLWILAAVPFATPALSDPALVSRQVLDLVNAARGTGRRCGNRVFGPAPPLRLSTRLRGAALVHSRDMAAHSYLSHVGRDGSTPAERVTRAGYAWRAVGENIAAGPLSAREAADGWLASPEHCANIMDPHFTETAVAYIIDRRSRAGVYWTEVFARPLH